MHDTTTNLAALDHLLAEKVLGWHVVDDCWSHSEPSGVLGYSHDVPGYPVDAWEPTADIAQAFIVAEKIGLLRLADCGSNDDERWRCEFSDLVVAYAGTASLAICFAASEWLSTQEAKP